MMRRWRPGKLLRAGQAIVTATTLAAAAPAVAIDDGFAPPSTLAPNVAPHSVELDKTIASLVRRGAFAKTQAEAPQPPAPADPLPDGPALAARPSTRHTQWRPAGQDAPADPRDLGVTPVPAGAADEPTTNTDQTTDDAGDQPSGAEAEPADGPMLLMRPAAEEELAPIDELSDTPAPETDAPGDPSEPEMTGEAIESALLPPAKPLSQAPKAGLGGNVPLGEPDRPARSSKAAKPPADPKQYQQPEESSPPAVRLPPLSKNQRMLRDKVRRVLKNYYDRPLSAANRSPWEIMHAALAFEVHSRVLQGGPGTQPITAVGWLCFNQPCENRDLLYLNEGGELRVKVGPALQGHHGQLLAILAQARVRSDYPIKVEGKDFTVADLIEVEKATCYPRTELTFKLIGLQRYLDVNERWVNDQGMTWDFPTLMREEMQQPVRSAACGGTHRLSGLALAVKKRRASGLPVDGVYAEAERFVANYVNYAYRLQNADGSFSTAWFNGPGAEADVDRRLKTTGHILEWLIYASSDEQLANYRTVRAVNYLTNIMYANRTRDWEAGPLGHAIHALVLYDRLAFAPYDQATAEQGPLASQQRRANR
ncbi:MAG: hypothetical protein IT424_14645 [Pirellulales bacterium]|nr:hypothetical protein [Pirellulales bacterium]